MRSYDVTKGDDTEMDIDDRSSTTTKYKWISLDPGLRAFLTGWSPEGIVYYFGQELYNRLFMIDKSMQALQSKIDTRVNDLISLQSKLPDFPKKLNEKGRVVEKSEMILEYRSKFEKVLQEREVLKRGLLESDTSINNWQNEINSKLKKIKRMIQQLHQETSDFLVNEFDLIIIPQFGQQDMYKKRNSGKGLSKNFKTVMSHLAHCEFRNELIGMFK